MIYFKLLNNTSIMPAGGVYTFKAKHMLMAKLAFEEQRQVLWEQVEAIHYMDGVIDDSMLLSYLTVDKTAKPQYYN